MLHRELIGVSKNTNFLMRLLIIACCCIQSTCPNPDVLIGVCLYPSQKGDFFKLIYEALKSIFLALVFKKPGNQRKSGRGAFLMQVKTWLLFLSKRSSRRGYLRRGAPYFSSWIFQVGFPSKSTSRPKKLTNKLTNKRNWGQGDIRR